MSTPCEFDCDTAVLSTAIYSLRGCQSGLFIWNTVLVYHALQQPIFQPLF